MKTIHFFTATLLIISMSGYADIKAQDEVKKGIEQRPDWKREHSECTNEWKIPNLTDEQKTKIKSLQVAHFKEIQPLKNQLGELKAKEHSLTNCDKPDLKAINTNIDEISKVENQLMKTREANRQQIRAILTDEQRTFFDMHKRQGQRHRKGPGNSPENHHGNMVN